MKEIESVIRARHLLRHPFYVAWSCGEVERSTLQEYAGQYYQFERNFPRYVASAYARLTDPGARRRLLENLQDEEGRDPTHPELWLRFAEAIDVPRSRVRAARPTAGTQQLLANYESLALDATAPEALAALYAYESIFPEVAAEKARGLATHYGVRSRRALEFFRVHAEADVAHSAAERTVLRTEIARSNAARRAALRATERTVGAWWHFLDAFAR